MNLRARLDKLEQGAPSPSDRRALDANAELTFRIDLTITDRRTDEIIAVLDTKYKEANKPSEEDIQQVVAYAVETHAKRAFLIYPGAPEQKLLLKTGDIEVRSLDFDTSVEIAEGGSNFLATLQQAIPN